MRRLRSTRFPEVRVHRGAWGDRFPIYQYGERGWAYNPSLREWELFEIEADGTIHDLVNRVRTLAEAERWAGL